MVAPPNVAPARPDKPRGAEVPAYRTDLDGLRGIAIALVAVFHIWFGKVSGGVDVFLTLSGYFFIGSLLRHTIHAQQSHITYRDAISPWPRLKRLLKRLLPALFTVLIAVAILTVAILPETRWANVGRELQASAFYYQNWYLALNSQDYLAASYAVSPLQHIWSMAVQGQFFLGTLLVAMAIAGALKFAAGRFAPLAKPNTIRLIIGLGLLGVAAVSFYWAWMRMELSQPFNYYDTLARLWEPLLGGLLAVWMPKVRMPSWLRSLIVFGALALIISSGFWINGVMEYPGPMALVPAGATVAIIFAGAAESPRTGETVARQPLASRWLAARWGVWLGGIAYSLYLWHWPLLIFYLAWRRSNEANLLEGAVLLALSILLAWLTKRYIEDPLRNGSPVRASRHRVRRAGRRLSYTAVVTILLVIGTVATGAGVKAWQHHVANLTVDTTNLDPALYPGGRALLHDWPVPALDPQPSPLEVVRDYPETSTDGFMSDFHDTEIYVGEYGDLDADRVIAVVGGSHSEMWITALNLLGQRNGFKVQTYLKMGCPLSTDPNPVAFGGPYPKCYDFVLEVMDILLEERPDAVFTTATRPDHAQPGDYMPVGYAEIFAELVAADIPVLGLRDTPWPHNHEGGIDTPECLAEGGDAISCGTPRELAISEVSPLIAFADAHPGFYVLDLTDGVCDDTVCPAVVGNIIVYKDWHHLSATYVRSLTDELGRQMAEALPWTGPDAR